MDLKLKDKIVLITGGTGGIGRAMTKAFLEEGCKVAITGRTQAKLDSFAEELNVGDRLWTCAGDIMIEEDVAKFVNGAAEFFGGIDVLCPNAGIESYYQEIKDFSKDNYDRSFNTNVLGVCYTIKYAVPYMLKKGKGSIIVTGSNGSILGCPGMTIYCASKHAVAGVVKSVAAELGPYGINCNYLAPGGVDTDMMLRIEHSTFGDTKTHEEAMAVFCDAQCFDKRYAMPEEVAFMATVMASEWMSHTSGARIPMDGGVQEVLRP